MVRGVLVFEPVWLEVKCAAAGMSTEADSRMPRGSMYSYMQKRTMHEWNYKPRNKEQMLVVKCL